MEKIHGASWPEHRRSVLSVLMSVWYRGMQQDLQKVIIIAFA
jgi:hypothetical protein